MFRRLIASCKNELLRHHRQRVERKRQAALKGNPLCVEALEARALLATLPVAFDDPLYSTPLNTDLVVSTSSGTKLLANDYDSEFLPLTSTGFGTPQNGTLISTGSSG